MRVLTPLLGLLAILALSVAPAWADEMLSLKVGYLTLSPEGQFAVSDGVVGTTVDMDDDLGFDDSEELMAEAAFQWGSFRLSAGYLPLEFSGDGTLTRSITFGGQTFAAGIEAQSDVDVDLYDLSVAFHLLNFDDLPVRLQLGPEVSVKLVDADVSFQNRTLGIRESESVMAPVPTIGLRGRVGLADFLGVVGRVGFLDYDNNSFVDADLQVEFSPLPLVGVFAGYRYFDIEVDEEDVFIDVQFEGPYGGVLVRF